LFPLVRHHEIYLTLIKRFKMNDPELKAMAAVYDALQGLDANTRQRVADWVLAKLGATGATAPAGGAKRGRKPGKKRGRKPGAVKAAAVAATPAKKKGKRGRPKGSANKTVKAKKAVKKSGRGPGRPKKAAATA
jgi:hypothetical protein